MTVWVKQAPSEWLAYDWVSEKPKLSMINTPWSVLLKINFIEWSLPNFSMSPSKSVNGYSNDSSDGSQLSPQYLFKDFNFIKLIFSLGAIFLIASEEILNRLFCASVNWMVKLNAPVLAWDTRLFLEILFYELILEQPIQFLLHWIDRLRRVERLQIPPVRCKKH